MALADLAVADPEEVDAARAARVVFLVPEGGKRAGDDAVAAFDGGDCFVGLGVWDSFPPGGAQRTVTRTRRTTLLPMRVAPCGAAA